MINLILLSMFAWGDSPGFYVIQSKIDKNHIEIVKTFREASSRVVMDSSKYVVLCPSNKSHCEPVRIVYTFKK